MSDEIESCYVESQDGVDKAKEERDKTNDLNQHLRKLKESGVVFCVEVNIAESSEEEEDTEPNQPTPMQHNKRFSKMSI